MGRTGWWWLFAAACGGGGGAPSNDAAVLDAVVIDAPPPTDVEVTTYVRCCGMPPLTAQAGVTVVAIQPNSEVVVAVSDATGHVTLHDIQANATVYAGYPESDAATTTLVTVFGVKPGDHLVFGEKVIGAWDAHGTAGTLTVNLPAYAGANSYRVSSGCSSIQGSSPISVPIIARCQTPTSTFASIAYNSGTPIATSYATNVAYTPGTTYNTGAWIPLSPITFSMSGLAGVTSYVDFSVGSVGTIAADGTFGRVVPTNGAISSTLSAPRSAPAIFVYATPELGPSHTGKHEFMARLAPNAITAQLVDPGIPWVGEVTGDSTTLSWSQTAGPYDAASVALAWIRVDVDSTRHTFVWLVVLPSGVTSLEKYPTLPPELDPFVMRPADEQNVLGVPSVTLVDFTEAANYDGARALPEWALTLPTAAATAGDVEGVAVAHNPP
jgi:hypothetical protein